MKAALTVIFLFTFSYIYSQDTLKIRQIDSLVAQINVSDLPVQRDTLIQDYSEMGLKMITYLEMIVKEGELIKYVNKVNTTTKEDGLTKRMNSANTFYYNNNKLIKVEEYLIEGDNKFNADWYYSEDKPLHNTLKIAEAEDRAALLLTMSKTMLKQIIK